MTKQEKIQEAYGEHWDEVKNIVDENGWTKWIKLNRSLYLEFSGLKQRPKSLQGIENNNGWIKIESEDDLPKKKGDYWCIDKILESNLTREFYDPKALYSMNERWYDRISHYQPIIKPLPPTY